MNLHAGSPDTWLVGKVPSKNPLKKVLKSMHKIRKASYNII